MKVEFDEDDVRESVEKGAKERKKVQSEFREVDFFAGAMAVYFALGVQDKLPAKWVFNPLGGEKIIKEEEK